MVKTKSECYLCKKPVPEGVIGCPHCGEYLASWGSRDEYEEILQKLTGLLRKWDKLEMKGCAGTILNKDRHKAEKELYDLESHLIMQVVSSRGLLKFGNN